MVGPVLDVFNRMPWKGTGATDIEPLVTREWLVTNGLGGYATGTVAGANTRRYHGLLIAALPSPLGRTMMLNHLFERVRLPDETMIPLAGEERPGVPLFLPGAGHLAEFWLEAGLPAWRYEVGDAVIEKRLMMPHLQNTAVVTYRMLSGPGPVRLELHPAVHFRNHDHPVNRQAAGPYTLSAVEDRYEIAAAGGTYPPLRMRMLGRRVTFTLETRALPELHYRVEASRGYESEGALWSPGFFRADLDAGDEAALIASTEPWETMDALPPAEAFAAERERRVRLLLAAHPGVRTGPGAELVLAADQFLIKPAGRVADEARAHAAGDEVRSVIAGYHWFTDWGRDTMISLEGLTLTTGRHLEAGYILRTFAHYVRDGLIPNFFPDGKNEGVYHTADATLWFFHALARYVAATGDRETLRDLIPKLLEIVDHHLKGTRFGIGVDPEDGLLREGAPGYQLTWMDAKVGDWVVTPRRGKPVEINALWYNALRHLEGWVREARGEAEARPLAEHAERARRSFHDRFWYAEGGYLYDVIDGEGGDDPDCRPNQLFAIALDHPVLDPSRWEPVFEVVRERLLTPVGLRSLTAGDPDYKPRYFGDLHARDAAYHQGTVWAWLIGPFVDAYLKLHPDDRAGARRFLEGFVPHLAEFGIGSIAEIFDAEAPFTPRGCIAQAWSVAEVLRCWAKTSG